MKCSVLLIVCLVCLPLFGGEKTREKLQEAQNAAEASFEAQDEAFERLINKRDSHQWTFKSSGKERRFTGKFVYLKNAKVFIKHKNGDMVQVSMSSLSVADQKYVREFMRKK